MAEKDRHRKNMPSWMTTEQAKWFRHNVTEEEFRRLMEAKSGMIEVAREKGINPNHVNQYWYKGKNYSISVKKDKEQSQIEQIREDFFIDIELMSPEFPPIQRTTQDDLVCFVISPSDIHIGKLGYDYDMKEAKKRFEIAIEGLIQKALLFNIDSIILVGGNDVLHIDNEKRTTTAGTPQDTEGTWCNAFNFAFELYTTAILRLLEIADVHYVHCMSNHDYKLGWTFSKALEAYFCNSSNITFDCSEKHRKYTQYGSTLIGFSHGDGAKDRDLVDLMKREAKGTWSKCNFGYWILGHLHHSIKKQRSKTVGKEYGDVMVLKPSPNDLDAVNIHYCRSISGTDTWHEKMGYTANHKGMDGFIIHKQQGMIAQLTQYV